MRLGLSVLVADMPETDRLWTTITGWWEAIEVLIASGVTNARTQAANTTIKQIKRTGRGYRNPQGRVAGGIAAPGSHRSRRDGLPSPGSCHPHRQAVVTQAQCRNSRGWLAASSASFRCATRVSSNRRYLLRIQRTR